MKVYWAAVAVCLAETCSALNIRATLKHSIQSAASASAIWGSTDTPQCCFWSKNPGEGDHFCFDSDAPWVNAVSPQDFNTYMSYQISDACTAEIFRDVNFAGPNITLSGGTQGRFDGLQLEGNGTETWAKHVSSFKCACTKCEWPCVDCKSNAQQGGSGVCTECAHSYVLGVDGKCQLDPHPLACIFETPTFDGARLCVNRDAPWIGDALKNKVKSAKIPSRCTVTGYDMPQACTACPPGHTLQGGECVGTAPYNYVGCYYDTKEQENDPHMFSDNSVEFELDTTTAEQCDTHCQKYMYFSLQRAADREHRICACSNAFELPVSAQTVGCQMCENGVDVCGGVKTVGVYKNSDYVQA
eukprot:GDKI01037631.1.p1 GENE.GDKI01037631.1~~GDKI01037631.1.p1  ORF type:complete len:357 (-),score=89.66 GDKI01037631.1:41-1111(-)